MPRIIFIRCFQLGVKPLIKWRRTSSHGIKAGLVYAASKRAWIPFGIEPRREKNGLISKQALKGLSAVQVPSFSAHSVQRTEGAPPMITPQRRQSIYKCGSGAKRSYRFGFALGASATYQSGSHPEYYSSPEGTLENSPAVSTPGSQLRRERPEGTTENSRAI